MKNLFSAYQQAMVSLINSPIHQSASFEEATAGELILLAFSEGCLAGFISIWLPDRFIHHLYVSASYRKQGIATALLQAAITQSGLPVQLKCLEANEVALQLYTRMHFKSIAFGSSDEGPYQLMQYPMV